MENNPSMPATTLSESYIRSISESLDTIHEAHTSLLSEPQALYAINIELGEIYTKLYPKLYTRGFKKEIKIEEKINLMLLKLRPWQKRSFINSNGEMEEQIQLLKDFVLYRKLITYRERHMYLCLEHLNLLNKDIEKDNPLN